MAAPMSSFIQAKKTRLKTQDLSKKGSIDEEILELVNYINDTEHYCTTSSCSGRIIVVCEENDVIKKKGCRWLYVSHKATQLAEIEASLKDLQGKVVFKYEPFILHVQCRTIEDAKMMHVVAVESGFRNSGITIGKAGKVMVAVRSTHGLEVPLSDDARLLVSTEYLAFLVDQANAKLRENSKRILRFQANLTKRLDTPTPEIKAKLCKHCGATRSSQHHSGHSRKDMEISGTETNEWMNRQSGESMVKKQKPRDSSFSCNHPEERHQSTSEEITGLQDPLENDDSDELWGFDMFT
ncbi:tRNA wybutosine-synthesizing protein 3 homolog [Asterias rubens]|uniref:tRNA wybutosine-synthesizing protein 3 homolog n=1 Tax=Asterias rubens TaxID=7604 RepID=UPI001455C83A|nr:tRNA wybutosine-synthesizing protein 3 homolog [Asterias rubens]